MPAVLTFLFGADHMDDYTLDVIDTLASDERVAVVARSTGRRGEQHISNDFIQLLKIQDRRVIEVWDYKWDQQALAEFAAPLEAGLEADSVRRQRLDTGLSHGQTCLGIAASEESPSSFGP